jgi:hypothetical protein
MNHEEELVKAFILPERRERYLSLLTSRKGRKKFLERLSHNVSTELDSRFAHHIDGTAKAIEEKLKKKGATDTCYVLSEDSNLDGREMPLADALEETVGYGSGTFLSCIPGKLAYFEGEDRGERYLLER